MEANECDYGMSVIRYDVIVGKQKAVEQPSQGKGITKTGVQEIGVTLGRKKILGGEGRSGVSTSHNASHRSSKRTNKSIEVAVMVSFDHRGRMSRAVL